MFDVREIRVSCMETLSDLKFVLVGTVYQNISGIWRELMISDGLNPVLFNFMICDVTTEMYKITQWIEDYCSQTCVMIAMISYYMFKL